VIAPLRRRHRIVIPALLLTLVIVALLAVTHRPAATAVDRLPPGLISSPGLPGER
jgi:hypothetical protein